MKFFPDSEHHSADYRIDLGQWTNSKGEQWDLGIAKLNWFRGEVYYSDYSLPSNEAPDYSSGNVNWQHYIAGDPRGPHLERKNELMRRALKIGIDPRINGGHQAVWWTPDGTGHYTPADGVEYPVIDEHTDWEPEKL